jgi:GMP synthase-like glutamine amidotransferase
MNKPILILQQLSCEPPGLLSDILREEGWEMESVLVSDRAVPDTPEDYAGIIVMGGPMSANDTHLDFIRAELNLLTRAIAADSPVLGICLGAQLLARAAGAGIYPAEERELGWYTLYPTSGAASDPLFEALPKDGLKVFQWHGETFSLPSRATLLARCNHVPHQAFRLGSCQYGLQFHVEVNEAIIRCWVDVCDSERSHLGPRGVEDMLNETSAHLVDAHAFCRRMTRAWAGLL